MWLESAYFAEDLEMACRNHVIPWSKLDGKRILVTGGTGLIGSTLISAILYYGTKVANPPKAVALVRDIQRAKRQFQAQILDCPNCIEFVESSVENPFTVEGAVDYIIHGASQTASKKFAENPVETIKTAVWGTDNLLRLAVQKKSEGFVYLSSMEAYGTIKNDSLVSEADLGYLNPLSVRSCYPESKRMCENLCACYASEYDVPAMVCRLVQTFGPGVNIETDARVLSYFLRCAKDQCDIKLGTPGNSKRMCLYTMDAVTAILLILLKGEKGCAYNAANEATFSTIRETAELVKSAIASDMIRVHVPDVSSEEALCKYPPEYKLNLDCSALRNLGWEATRSMKEILLRAM